MFSSLFVTNHESAAVAATTLDEVYALNLGAMIDLYKQYRQKSPRRAASNKEKEASRLRRLQRELGHLTLGEVRLSDITTMKRMPRSEKKAPADVLLSPNSISKLQKLLRAAFRYIDSCLLPVETRGSLRHHPVLTERISGGSKTPRDTRVTNAELDRVCAYIRKPANVIAIKLLLQTGLRRGELLRLTWADVSLANKELRIHDPSPGIKNKVQERKVPLSGDAITLIQQLESGQSPKTPLLATTARSLEQAFAKARKRAGLDDLHLHDLRREFASREIESGAQIEEVAQRTGHRDLSTLCRHYARPSPAAMAEKIGGSGAANDDILDQLISKLGFAA